MAEKKRGKGHPRTFDSGEKLLDLWREYVDGIAEMEYKEVPTVTGFCKWLADGGCDRRTVYNALHHYFPAIKKEFDEIRADVIAQGTMLGHYQPSMAIFALKNWAKWTDKQEVQSDTTLRVLMDGLDAYVE